MDNFKYLHSTSQMQMQFNATRGNKVQRNGVHSSSSKTSVTTATCLLISQTDCRTSFAEYTISYIYMRELI